ncbi:MAG: DUF1559 domain-containing protein [Planctomycetota bacterium]
MNTALSVRGRGARVAASRESAFTLVELLTVIAIIGILVSMMLPAVNGVREAARRAQCSNNIRNLAMAIHNYQSANRHYPPGCLTFKDGSPNGAETVEMWAWGAFILPYVEQENLFNILKVNDRPLFEVFGTEDQVHLQTPLAVFRCPSDTTENPLSPDIRHFNGKYNKDEIGLGVSNFVGCRGFWDLAGLKLNNGVLFNESKIDTNLIPDGSNQTFLLGERDRRCAAASWPGVRNPPGEDHFGVAHALARVSIKLNDSDAPVGKGKADSCSEGFSSAHPFGGNFAFCDGSVRFVSDLVQFNNAGFTQEELNHPPSEFYGRLDYAKNRERVKELGIYQRYGIRNDGYPIPEEEY